MTKTLQQWATRYQTDVDALSRTLESIRHTRTGDLITIGAYSRTWLALRLGLTPSPLMPGTRPTDGPSEYCKQHIEQASYQNGN
jgi:hypothetical protein